MSEYNITKIIDGLFISDNYVPIDSNFLIGNKVIRMLGWTNYVERHEVQQQNILQFHLNKNEQEVKLPKWQQLQKGFQFLEVIHDEMLCGLIYSQSQLQASLICIMYLMYKFNWDYQTSYNFIKSKMEMFQFSDETQEELQNYQRILEDRQGIKLKNIIWEYDYLAKYRSQSDQQLLIITTTKNKLRKFNPKTDIVDGKSKKPRIRWYDQVRPSSAKYLSLHKNSRVSINKPKYTSPSNQNMQISQINLATQINPVSIFQDFTNSLKNTQILQHSLSSKSFNAKAQRKQQKQQNWDQDTQYLQLKQLSRTNFNDKKYMTSQIRRRGSLKTFKDKNPKNNPSQNCQSSISLNNINSILGIYGNSNTKNSNKSKSSNLSKTNAQSFLNNLKNFNKTTFNS